jgi:hypothetical protein
MKRAKCSVDSSAWALPNENLNLQRCWVCDARGSVSFQLVLEYEHALLSQSIAHYHGDCAVAKTTSSPPSSIFGTSAMSRYTFLCKGCDNRLLHYITKCAPLYVAPWPKTSMCGSTAMQRHHIFVFLHTLSTRSLCFGLVSKEKTEEIFLPPCIVKHIVSFVIGTYVTESERFMLCKVIPDDDTKLCWSRLCCKYMMCRSASRCEQTFDLTQCTRAGNERKRALGLFSNNVYFGDEAFEDDDPADDRVDSDDDDDSDDSDYSED